MDGGSRWRNSGEVMEGEEHPEHPDLVASWKAERRWFRRTVALATFLAACSLGWLALRYGAFLKDQEINKAFASLVSTI